MSSYNKPRNNNIPYHSNEGFEKLMSELPIRFDGKGNKFGKLLDDLQSNILRHHGKENVAHIFIHFKSGKEKEAINWITGLADEKTGGLISAKKQIENRQADVCSFYLTGAGYGYLGLLDVAPKQSEHPAFWADFTERTAMPKKFLDGSFRPKTKGGAKEVHAMLMCASNDENTITEMAGLNKGMAEVKIQKGFIRYEGSGVSRSWSKKARGWFGYKDGISTPLFFPNKNMSSFNKQDLAPLNTILVKDRGAREFSAGSFLAMLKLEQDVAAFNERVDTLSGKINGDKSVAKAMMMGRFEDGTPITSSRKDKSSADQRAFDYDSKFVKKRTEYLSDEEGARCPFISHIRKANPRKVDSDYEKRKIVRRGVQYDERTATEKKGNKVPNKNVGMLFLSFQKNIQNQFEHILNKRMLKKMTDGIYSGLDAVLGHSDQDLFYFPNEWNSNKKVGVHFDKPCVKLKDGLYLYAPSLTFLRRIGHYSSLDFKVKNKMDNGEGNKNRFAIKSANKLKLKM